MKTIIKLSIALALVVLPFSAFSQYFNIDVNGIVIGNKYTKSQVTAKLGAPTKYWSGTSEFGLDEEYKYSNNLFRFGEDGVFQSFYIYTSTFTVLTPYSGGVKVGDTLSKLSTLGLGTPVLQNDGSYRLGKGDDPFLFGISNGKIAWISYTWLN